MTSTESTAHAGRKSALRIALAAGAAAAAVAALSACASGQMNQTAYIQTAVPGVNQTWAVSDGTANQGSVSIRNLLVTYPGPAGYKAGADAPLEVRIFNDSPATVKVTVTAPGAASAVTLAGSGVTTVKTEPSAAASPSASAPAASASVAAKASGSTAPSAAVSASASAAASPSAAAPAGPATITIPAHQFAVLDPAGKSHLVLSGLTKALAPGTPIEGLDFAFQFEGGLSAQSTPVDAPMAPPSSPLPRSPIAVAKNEE